MLNFTLPTISPCTTSPSRSLNFSLGSQNTTCTSCSVPSLTFGLSGRGGTNDWDNIVNKPTCFTPCTHSISLVTGTGTGYAYWDGSVWTFTAITSSYITAIADTATIDLVVTGSTLTANLIGSFQPLDADLTAIAALTGTSGFLKTNGSGTWSVDTATYLTSVTAHNLLSTTHGDTNSAASGVTRGDVMVGNSTPKWDRLALGTVGKIFRSDGTDIVYSTATYPDIVTTKEIMFATGTNAFGTSSNFTWDDTTKFLYLAASSGVGIVLNARSVSWGVASTTIYDSASIVIRSGNNGVSFTPYVGTLNATNQFVGLRSVHINYQSAVTSGSLGGTFAVVGNPDIAPVATLTTSAGGTTILLTAGAYNTTTASFGVGDRISLNAGVAYATVTAITATDSLTVDTSIGSGGAGQTFYHKSAIFRAFDSSNTLKFIINDLGNVGIGVTNPSSLLSVGTGSPFTVNSSGTISTGLVGGTTGAINFKGTTSGTVTLTTAAAAGTWTMTLPTSGGTVDYVLRTDGTGVTSWVAAAAGGAGTVTSFTFTDNNSFKGTVTNSTTTPTLVINSAITQLMSLMMFS